MSHRMLDSAFAPSAQSLTAARADGVQLWAGYLGQSWRAGAYNVWSRADFQRVAAAGIEPVEIWFPPQGWNAFDVYAGTEAVAAAKAAGLSPGHIIGIDEEAHTDGPLTVANVQRFSADVRAGGFRSMAYGLSAFIAKVAQAVDLTWRAVYGRKPASVADRDGVQWWNSHTAYGSGVDESLVGDAWLSAVLTPSSPITGGPFTVADLDQNLVNRGLIAFMLGLLGEDVTGPNIDFLQAHAADVGAGQTEWEVEGILGGTDPAFGASGVAMAAAYRRLRTLGAGQIAQDMQAAVAAALVPAIDVAAVVAAWEAAHPQPASTGAQHTHQGGTTGQPQ